MNLKNSNIALATENSGLNIKPNIANTIDIIPNATNINKISPQIPKSVTKITPFFNYTIPQILFLLYIYRKISDKKIAHFSKYYTYLIDIGDFVGITKMQDK